VYTLIHIEEHDMATTKVGIREFRAGLADYIDAEAPIAVTRHGQTVGFFIPTKSDLSAEVAALKSAAAQLDALLQLEESDVDKLVEEFKGSRRKARK
jgi:antitoxin (DNA-binding transcriptional repressor) of toxin-antitoxin stability system